MRRLGVLLHRWFGLFTAVFLFVSGLTGAVISWDHELDEWLNPHLFENHTAGTHQPPMVLANQLEVADPRLLVSYVPLYTEEGHSLGMGVDARMDQSIGKIYPLDFNQVAIDPVTGLIQGQREWGAVSLSKENLLPFLYKLHYSLHIPNGWNLEIGVLFMGIVAIVWVLDGFIALWISFPRSRSWKKSFNFRWHKGPRVINFDLHRSGGVCLWLLLLVMAVTSVSMNLGFQVVRPVVSWFSKITPSPFEQYIFYGEENPVMPAVTREQVIANATEIAQQRGWSDPAGGVFYSVEFGIYGVGFFSADNDHGDGGLGNPWLYFDGQDGRYIGDSVPGTGSAGDIFLQAQFPLHSGRILGLPGRILISLMGLVVAILSVTGVVIWLRKRRFIL